MPLGNLNARIKKLEELSGMAEAKIRILIMNPCLSHEETETIKKKTAQGNYEDFEVFHNSSLPSNFTVLQLKDKI
jgi:UDP-N-acetylglucosamine pyrophosphorylase